MKQLIEYMGLYQKKGILLVSLLWLLTSSCQNGTKKPLISDQNGDENIREELKTPSVLGQSPNEDDDHLPCPEFPCTENLDISRGAIQGLNDDQLSEVLFFGRGNCKNESIEIIWKHNKKKTGCLDFDELEQKVYSINYSTFIFKIPLLEIENDILEDPYKFPCNVSAFVIRSGVCRKTEEVMVPSWEEYVQLQYRTIYSNK